jgi:hypothetical protein
MTHYYNSFDGQRFIEVFPDIDTFTTSINGAGIPLSFQENNTLSTIYYLLLGRYANDIIASSDTGRFVTECASLIFQYGPTWERNMKVQEELRALDIEQLKVGAIDIHNHSYNPGSAPSTQTMEELPTINDQNVSKRKRSAPEAYSLLMSLMDDTLTDKFLDKFRKLFLRLVAPTTPVLYDVEELVENAYQ